MQKQEAGEENSTLSKHSPLFLASCRARSRRRSYSCSASLLWEWLKAAISTEVSICCAPKRVDSAKVSRTSPAQLGHCVGHDG